MVRLFRPAVFLIAIAVLFLFASTMLLVSLGFGITADEIMVNPNARLEDKTRLEHAASLSLGLFAAGQVALVPVFLMSGFLKARLHVAIRATAVFLTALLASWLFVLVTAGAGVHFFAGIERAMSAWIERVI
jgi:hypothetical protein